MHTIFTQLDWLFVEFFCAEVVGATSSEFLQVD